MDPSRAARAEKIQTAEELASADFGTKATFASAAAWSPNPNKPPLFLDLPVKEGQTQPGVLAKWVANAPLAMIDQYIVKLRQLRAVALDVGDRDGLAAGAKLLDQVLTDYKIAHLYEVYPGDHVNGVHGRLENNVFPFFSKQLAFQRSKR